MTPEAEKQQQRVNEFMRLLPVTLALAGLPESEHGKYFNEGQLEARATTLRQAYKVARQLIVDVVQ
ncbi:MAG: hypothetical protein ACFCD0_30210 [Gemmataceae bacterium]